MLGKEWWNNKRDFLNILADNSFTSFSTIEMLVKRKDLFYLLGIQVKADNEQMVQSCPWDWDEQA